MKYSVNKSISFNQSASSLFKSKSTLSISNAKSNTKSHHKDSSYSSILLPYNMNNKIQGSLNSERHSKKHYKNESVSSISALQRSSSTTFTTIKNVSSMKIAFGKIVPKENNRLMLLRSVTKRSTRTEIDEPIKKRVSSTSRMRPETAREVINIFKTGLGKKEKEKIIGTEEEIEKSKKKKNEYNKGFPLIAPKKIVKNILPKEYDFNKVKTPEEVLRNAYHPVVRYQKNVLNKHINAINQEINVNYSNTFCLIKKDKFSEKFRMCQDLIDLEKDTKLIEMIGELINKNFKLGNEINEVLEEKKRKEEYERKQKILLRFKQVLIRAAIHFKRLNINLDDFLTKNSKTIQPFEEASTYNLICAIKDKDPEAVLRMIKQNKFVVFDFDHFKQTPLHWAAKRNLYQVISLLVSKGANSSAQDEIGRTPLHIAAFYNNIEALQILLYELANPLIKNNEGETPFDVATDPVIQFILQRACTLHKLREGCSLRKYEKSIKSGLEFLFVDEIKTNFESLKPYIYT